MMLLGVTKQATLEKEFSVYCLRNVKQLPCVWGDSNACHDLNNNKNYNSNENCNNSNNNGYNNMTLLHYFRSKATLS